ncbi:uncharacterized protein LOC119402860 [Rhipicephalus sanguineus]|uniref:uncharacterized protein LOC119402860 n=1 Tax=Rhipicephalus sanguineus TaxID=34632 RepID=UPI00189564B3|nr:uncharacterized protein LOC119402860 [Rhipicephalus sanguineus]
MVFRHHIMFLFGLFFILFILAQGPTCVLSGQIISRLSTRTSVAAPTAVKGILLPPGTRRHGPKKTVRFEENLPTLRPKLPGAESLRRRGGRRRRRGQMLRERPEQVWMETSF